MFVVFGMPRSGTTLLAQCLNAHSGLVVPDETDFLVPVAHAMKVVDDPDRGRGLVADVICATDRFDATLGRWLDPDTVRRVVAGSAYRFDEIVTSLYGAVADAAGVALAGDKSPNDLPQHEILGQAGLFTDRIRSVHLVRDPRDVMVSMARLGWLNGIDTSYARLWRNANLGLRRRLAEHPDRSVWLRYEDLVADPTTALGSICALLDVDYEPAMVDDTARFSQFPEHKGMSQHANTYRPIGTQSVGRYESAFSATELAEVDELAGDALATFGYEPSS